MKILVIGGTQFVGRHVTVQALARGHSVTHFNRGKTAPNAPPGVTHLQGDRKAELSVLASGEWDAVIDTCGYLPHDVARMADTLRGRVGRYVFVSSISVYRNFATPNPEGSAVGTIEDTGTDVVDGRTYGPLKALCESALRERFDAARTLIVRPGLIVGPHDPTQRFTYWPARIARAADGDAVLVPGAPGEGTQFIDARDLCSFIVGGIEAGLAGCFNVTSPAGQWTLGELFDTCAQVAGCRPRWVRADAAAAERLKLAPWSDLPVWVPAVGDEAAFAQTDVTAAVAAGLRTRPLDDTVADTLAWYRGLPPEAQAFTRAGLSPAREAAALAVLA
ncbi:MAG TPA: NAD-dependent epimerase/dehydratase family protein [Rubrivivax sp.]